MRRNKMMMAAMAFALLAGSTFGAGANWQGTFYYYDDEGALVGGWTAGCGEADGRWGIETDNKRFVQGCRDSS